MESRPRLSIVIPVYRSEQYLQQTVLELLTEVHVDGELEVVLVNDASPDGVQRVIEKLAAEDRRIRWVELGTNGGQHPAVLRGLALARGEVVVTVDDDGQNPPSAVLATYQTLVRDQADVVYGRFASRQQSAMRRWASAANRWMSRQALRNERGLAISNVRAIRGDLARKLGHVESAYPYVDALVFRATRRIGEVAVEHRPRADGASTYRLSALIGLWVSHLTTLTVLPLKAAVAGCFTVSVVGFALGLVQAGQALAAGQAPAGWLSLFVAVTFLFSLLFVFLGIISIYLGRLYVGVNERGLVWQRGSSDARAANPEQPGGLPQ